MIEQVSDKPWSGPPKNFARWLARLPRACRDGNSAPSLAGTLHRGRCRDGQEHPDLVREGLFNEESARSPRQNRSRTSGSSSLTSSTSSARSSGGAPTGWIPRWPPTPHIPRWLPGLLNPLPERHRHGRHRPARIPVAGAGCARAPVRSGPARPSRAAK